VKFRFKKRKKDTDPAGKKDGIQVAPGSDPIVSRCPYCGRPYPVRDEIKACPVCGGDLTIHRTALAEGRGRVLRRGGGNSGVG